MSNLVKAEDEKSAKTKGSRSNKRELKNLEQEILKSTDLSTEEKLQILVKKYGDLLDENKSSQANVKVYERQLQTLMKEKEQLQSENGRILLARSRMEELCRELQRQNKTIKDESSQRIREEEERRKEVSGKFQSTLSEVSVLLQQNNEKNSKLREENSEMAGKLQMLCDQYTAREQHLEKLAKQYEIERQLYEARLAKAHMECAEMKEQMLQEKQKLLIELTEYQKKCQVMHQEEAALRLQLSMYTQKYDEFQKALSSSNQTFVGFKDQMDAMTKKLKTLEKETASWKQRWEKSNATLLEMLAEKKRRDADLAGATKQLEALQKLCRALQTERGSLLQKIKDIEAVNSVVPEAAPVADITLALETVNLVHQEVNESSVSGAEQVEDESIKVTKGDVIDQDTSVPLTVVDSAEVCKDFESPPQAPLSVNSNNSSSEPKLTSAAEPESTPKNTDAINEPLLN